MSNVSRDSSGAAARIPHPARALGRPRPTGEPALIQRVFDRCQRYLEPVCRTSSVPIEFLAALTANESAGNLDACRFEPAVYLHLKAVASGQTPAYGSIRAASFAPEIEDMLHPKAAEFHQRYLTAPFGANHAEELAAVQDDLLRELSTSWGFTQIMGYHVLGRAGRVPQVRDLVDPAVHYLIALELLAEFAHDYHLDPGREFEEMFRCWNTGRPYGKTFDPDYAANGVRRMALYQTIRRGATSAAQT